MSSCNPFKLFPNQTQPATLWKYTAPGLDNIKLADLNVIIKHSTQTNQPTEYASRITSRRFHNQTTYPKPSRKTQKHGRTSYSNSTTAAPTKSNKPAEETT